MVIPQKEVLFTSPWLYQLNRVRPVNVLERNEEAEVVIIGGGIAGVISAYFILRDTKKKVMLIEAGKIAHGATGHNAGQIVSYFERPFSTIVDEFGLTMAARGQKDLLSAWELLDTIYRECALQTPLTQFIGYAGCSKIEQLDHHLHNKWLRAKAGLEIESVFVSKESSLRKKIKKKYLKFCTFVDHAQILTLLETKDPQYFAALASHKGVMNSAMFCEEVVGYLLSQHKKRFRLIEHTPVKELKLDTYHARLLTEKYEVKAQKVILCTNGFENIKITTSTGLNIDGKFHELVMGVVGYMSGYLEKEEDMPAAISYFPIKKQGDHEKYYEDPYYYLTRRRYVHDRIKHPTLVCIGGPEYILADKDTYQRDKPYMPNAHRELKKFLQRSYRKASVRDLQHTFHWHGLMGYTKNGLRCIGPEPCNPILLYNLGCNGVGILPSIFGGKRIAQMIAGKKVPKSIFDPQDKRCLLKPTQAGASVRAKVARSHFHHQRQSRH